MLAEPVSRPWRKYLRFSVRGLIVLVLVIGGGLGWLVRSVRIQREAVAAIQKVGASVSYDWEWSDGKYTPGAKPWAPKWLADRIGFDYFGHVTSVVLWGSPTDGDEVIAQVGRLARLQRLIITESPVSEAGLAHLKGLANLSSLDLRGTHVTDAGLAHLKGLTKLSDLQIGGTQLTDAGLVHLMGLPKLSFLWLNSTKITDAGLVHLKGLTNLSILHIYNTRVSHAGIEELKQALPSLMISH